MNRYTRNRLIFLWRIRQMTTGDREVASRELNEVFDELRVGSPNTRSLYRSMLSARHAGFGANKTVFYRIDWIAAKPLLDQLTPEFQATLESVYPARILDDREDELSTAGSELPEGH